MSIKSPKKNTSRKTKIEGSLEKLIKQYDGTNVASQIESNLRNARLNNYPITTSCISLFNIDYVSNLINEESEKQLFPIYIFIYQTRHIIFGGFREYIKLKKNNATSFQAYVFSDIDEGKAVAYYLNEINKLNSPLLLAYAYKILKQNYDISYEALSKILHISKSQIINYVQLLNLPSSIQEAIKDNKLSYTLARPLNGIKDKKEQEEIFNLILKNNLSVHDVEDLIRNYRNPNIRFLNNIEVRNNKVVISCKDQEEANLIAEKLKHSKLLK